MRPRIRLTEDQLHFVARMRAQGHSWSAIGRETNLNRQAVKREYLGWYKRQAFEDLKTVRHQVAAEEFKKHLEAECHLARELIRHFEGAVVDLARLPSLGGLSGVIDSDQPLAFSEEVPVLGSSAASEGHRRHRQMLYQGLETHLLDTKWKARIEAIVCERDRCMAELDCLRALTRKDVPQVLAALELASSFNVDTVTNVVWDITWKMELEVFRRSELEEAMGDDQWRDLATKLWDDLFIPEKHLVILTPEGDGLGRWEVRILWRPNMLSVVDHSEAQAIVGLIVDCGQATFRTPEARVLALSLRRLEGHVRGVLDQLDPMRLTPVLLRTRCDLCPV